MSTAHFTDAELACSCGCGLLPPLYFQERLESFRMLWDRPMRLSSCARCSKHNQEVSSTGPHGPHTLGAADVLVSGPDAYAMLRAAIAFGWRGIGVNQRGPVEKRFLHLDNLDDMAHPRPRIWTY